MTCPKCGSEMRSYERNGITVDQCTGCRGLFLDRGELERLTEAEGAYYERAAPAAAPPPPPQRQDYGQHRPDYGDRHESHHYDKRRKKKKSFLDDFLDFG
jgi:uncharacterized protein